MQLLEPLTGAGVADQRGDRFQLSRQVRADHRRPVSRGVILQVEDAHVEVQASMQGGALHRVSQEAGEGPQVAVDEIAPRGGVGRRRVVEGSLIAQIEPQPYQFLALRFQRFNESMPRVRRCPGV